MKTIKIFIADDHEFFRKGIINVINDIKHIKVVGEAENGEKLLEKLKTIKPDIILMDIKMPVLDGEKTTIEVKKLYPDIKIIALSFFDEDDYLMKMIEARVDGYILKNTNKEGLEHAINIIATGKPYFAEEFMPFFTQQILNKDSKNKDNLTKREKEILQVISEGLTNKEIAEKLFISIKTVINHRTNILSKTNTKNTASLLNYAFKNNLVKFN